MINKIVYIAGCGHSGSTLLELLLSCNERCLGIGEAYQLCYPFKQVYKGARKHPCVCGEFIENCQFWGEIVKKLNRFQDMSPVAKYDLIVNRANELYHGKEVLIDSSKVPKAIKTVSRIENMNLRVIHLVKDVRSIHSIEARELPRL